MHYCLVSAHRELAAEYRLLEGKCFGLLQRMSLFVHLVLFSVGGIRSGPQIALDGLGQWIAS